MIKRVTKDFETRAVLELKKVGAYKYSLHPQTQPTCLAFKIYGEPTVYFLPFHVINRPWAEQEQKLKDLWLRLINEGYEFSAHNSFFERCIYDNILVKRYGWPKIPPRLRRCTAAKAAACALPRNLEGAGEALRLRVQKDRRGYAAMMATCKPTKAWNAWRNAVDDLAAGKRLSARRRSIAEAPEPPVFLEPEAAPDVWQTLYTYCKIDVRAEEAVDLALPDLIPQEQEIWHLNQKLNWRGLRVDLPTVKKIVGIMENESKKKLKELDALTMGLVTKPGARKSILEFLALEGIELPDLKSKTVEDALKGFELSEDMHRLLEIRKALTMTSTKKYYAFLNRADGAGQIRDLVMYHAASTGRDGGTGINPYNFPRGLIKVDKNRPYAAVENVVECDREMLELLYGDALAILFSAILRNMIVPSDGCELFVADFSKIEVAVLWWLADNKAGLDILRAGLDPYKYQAAANTGKTYQEITDEGDERQLGKAQVLGCFGPETPVLTRRGWVPIIQIRTNDDVWDGVEWVHHQGVICQGVKEVVECQGIYVTPDHLLLTPKGWRSAEAVLSEGTKSLAEAIDLASYGLRVSRSANAAASTQYSFLVAARPGLTIRWLLRACEKAFQLDVTPALKKLRDGGLKIIGDTRISFQKTHTESGYSIGSVPQSGGVKTQKIATTSTTVAGAFTFFRLGLAIVEDFLNTWWVSTTGISLITNWTGSMLTAGTNLETSVSSLAILTSLTGGKSRSCKKRSIGSSQKMKVYDISFAGPRNRFTIRTQKGPLIVHNCGFRMSWKRFQETAWSMYRLKLTSRQSVDAVKSYRDANKAVVELWDAYEEAAVEAVETGKIVVAGKCRFFVKDSFLWIELPSGRRLAYREPQLTYRAITYTALETDPRTGKDIEVQKTGRAKKTIQFLGLDKSKKKLAVEFSHGGILTENIVQATARDLMMPALLRLEAARYRVLLSVYDEGVCERPKGQGRVDEFVKILCEPPTWAPGLPLEAKGWTGPRYRK